MNRQLLRGAVLFGLVAALLFVVAYAFAGTGPHYDSSGGGAVGGSSSISFDDDTQLVFGTGSDAACEYDTAQTTDSFVCGVSSDSRAIIIMEKADISTDLAHAQETNPTLFIHAADAATTTKWIGINHNGTNGVVDVGTGLVSMPDGVTLATADITLDEVRGDTTGGVWDMTGQDGCATLETAAASQTSTVCATSGGFRVSSNILTFNSGSFVLTDASGNTLAQVATNGLSLGSDDFVRWFSDTTIVTGAYDLRLSRLGSGNLLIDNNAGGAAAVLQVTTDDRVDCQDSAGSVGCTFSAGTITSTLQGLTAATMTAATSAEHRTSVHKYSWTNAMVAALGATTTGEVDVVTLPAKTVIRNAYVVIDTACQSTTTLTVSVGRTGASYIDYIVASNAKAAANTVYGDASAERGTNNVGYDLPSYTGTTTIKAQFISTIEDLSAVTTCTGSVILETALVP